ncbi:hypothetical protein [Alloprevotella tannerae]|uniref:hypothetical protein n=1 Tax=Alloprevotella tannerae TaxID=76122 RepID=UPI0028EA668B|nr:hypothetical protein [Alloprevotella tannerae]
MWAQKPKSRDLGQHCAAGRLILEKRKVGKKRAHPAYLVYAREVKPFLSRDEAFFITSANLCCRDKKLSRCARSRLLRKARRKKVNAGVCLSRRHLRLSPRD